MGKGGLLGVGQQLTTSKPHAIQLEMGKGKGKVSATAHHHRELGTEDKCGHFCTYVPCTWHFSSRRGGEHKQNRCSLEEVSPHPRPHTPHVAMTNTGHTNSPGREGQREEGRGEREGGRGGKERGEGGREGEEGGRGRKEEGREGWRERRQ